MASSPATRFREPAIPWLHPQLLVELLDLGPGLDTASFRDGLVVLAMQQQVQPLVARLQGSRRRPAGFRSGSGCDLPRTQPHAG